MQMLTILVLLALVATVVSLALGINSMAHGGEYDQGHSTRFMSMRVGFQAITLVLLMLALYFSTT